MKKAKKNYGRRSADAQDAKQTLQRKRPAGAEQLLLVLITLACLLPFLNKGYNVDDPLFIWTAKQICNHPLDFYGFTVNWYGTVSPMAEVTKNPPGVCYYLALAGALFGWSEYVLHSAMLIPSVVAVLGMFYLAQLLCSKPLLAALAGIVTPVFLVSATNVMCDITMLGLLVWAIFFWIRGIRTNRQRYFLFSALTITACSLTKYFGVALIPLLIAYALLQKRRLGLWMCYLLIPVTFLAGYQWMTHSFYGLGLLWDAALFASGFQSVGNQTFLSKGLITLAFTGGCLASVLFYTPLLWSRKGCLIGVALIILLLFALASVQKIGAVPTRDGDSVKWLFLLQAAVMIATGVSVITLALRDFLTFRNAESLLLLLWVAGTFIFAGFVNWVINARSILPMAPAAGILIMRRIDQHRNSGKRMNGLLWAAVPLIPSVCIATIISWSDYQWAGTSRAAAISITRSFENRKSTALWFAGHWGFQYYMEAGRGKAMDLADQAVMPGDIVIFPFNNTNIPINMSLFQQHSSLLQIYEVGPQQWLTTMHSLMGAGFYSHLVGPLPFVFGLKDPEKYYAFIVEQAYTIRYREQVQHNRSS